MVVNMYRADFINKIINGFNTSPIVAMLGPRQCGKTTLAKEYFKDLQGTPERYFDLENPLDLLRLEDPMLALEDLNGLIVIDEIQRIPQLFTVLRVLVDQQNKKRKFLILGSASHELLQQSSESLAGRIHYIELTPFSFEETGKLSQLWLRGGFPRSFLAKSEINSIQWRKDYIKTFLEQD